MALKVVRKKGFTLVELMIVVAIIGILAAIAIPNFIRFQARSKQAEAKTNLKAIFTGQKSRFADRDAYSDSLGDIGFSPERGNRYGYEIGDGMQAPVTSNGAALACMTAEDRTMDTVPAAGAVGFCGVEADVFRYGANINAMLNVAGRGIVTWATSIAGNNNIPADNIGFASADCPRCDFAARALGNVDNDLGADEFFVSSQFASATQAACSELIDVMMQEQPGSPILTRNDVNCE
jgi:type IV pilus assembly protein PilA